MRPTLAASILAGLAAAAWADDPPPFRHAYYLFESAGPAEASTAYVPLLVTRVPIESEAGCEAAVVVTYERNAVWTLEAGPAALPPGAVDKVRRKISFREKSYRYQAATTDEVARLLENPDGEVPLHRIESPFGHRGEAEGLRDALIRDLRAADPCRSDENDVEARRVTVEQLNRWGEEGNYHLVRGRVKGCEIETPAVIELTAGDGALIVSLPGGRWRARVLNPPGDAERKPGDEITLRGLIVGEAFAHLWVWADE